MAKLRLAMTSLAILGSTFSLAGCVNNSTGTTNTTAISALADTSGVDPVEARPIEPTGFTPSSRTTENAPEVTAQNSAGAPTDLSIVADTGNVSDDDPSTLDARTRGGYPVIGYQPPSQSVPIKNNADAARSRSELQRLRAGQERNRSTAGEIKRRKKSMQQLQKLAKQQQKESLSRDIGEQQDSLEEMLDLSRTHRKKRLKRSKEN